MSSSYRIQAATGIHRGDREYQQDQVLLMAHPYAKGCILGVVADGMGGRSGGRKASDQVMLTARQLFERFEPAKEDCIRMLRTIVQDAHTVIRLTAIAAEQEPHSTIAAFIVLPDNRCHFMHSGDSRLYHFRGAALVHRSLDHSYVQALVERGELTEAQAQYHPQSNILLGCLGAEPPPPMRHHMIEKLLPGDSLMACSDGLWHYFTAQELGTVLDGLSPREASQFLIEKARRRAAGRGDNLSLAILKLDTSAAAASA
ncbi:PP2C family serine/threonine-protein phosphatase [Comamonas testosteroni]|uniref:PP2C family protein-serine/threonine phosphatase n=1 Tax=Comamonas testosteroni TaxID=285 RepID=UPI0026F1D0F5|nr:protein phosphatase 2C domain-containing protein [Comamonas testosteroni]WQD45401.1 protein phosphatase 2C domain-containing protein [Comamonas testosteroni]